MQNFEAYIQSLQNLQAQARDEGARLQKIRTKKRLSYYLFASLAGYYIALYTLIRFLNLFFPAKARLRLAGYFRHYLSIYFYFKGIRVQTPLPTFSHHPDRETIVIMPRINTYSPLLMYRLMPFPILIPMPDTFHDYRVICFLNLRFIGSVIKTISYPEANLTQNFQNIVTLLKEKFPLLIHANPQFYDGSLSTKPQLYRSLVEILKRDADIYLVKPEGFENFKFSTFFTPQEVRCNWVKKEDLFTAAELDNPDQAVEKLAAFFGMVEYTVI